MGVKHDINLTGIIIDNKWEVIERIEKDDIQSGGNFSQSYKVKNVNNNEIKFLKILEISQSYNQLGLTNFLDGTQRLIQIFKSEESILNICKINKMKNIIQMVDSGIYYYDLKLATGENFSLPIPYLIFEEALGNLYSKDYSLLLDKIILIKNVAKGLNQLHSYKISHQDIKPSNILQFDDNITKIGDLGSACKEENYQNAGGFRGALAYAPLEVCYSKNSYCQNNWQNSMLSCDMYMLGNLIWFLFNDEGLDINSKILKRLPYALHWKNFSNYNEVLPFILKEFNITLNDFSNQLPEEIKISMTQLLKELCHPDPTLRGTTKIVSYNQYSIQPYITKLSRIEKTLKYNISGGK